MERVHEDAAQIIQVSNNPYVLTSLSGFGSRVRLYPADNRIETEYIEGPFKRMESVWQFRDVPGGVEVSTLVGMLNPRGCGSSAICAGRVSSRVP